MLNAEIHFGFRHSAFLRHSTFGFRHSVAMPYRYLEEIGTADIAFEATGRDLPELFKEAADATTKVNAANGSARRRFIAESASRSRV